MEKINSITSKVLPKAVGPYSIATQFENLIFLSGQIPICPKTNQLIESDIEKQTIQVLENIKAFLNEQNLSFNNILKTTIYVKDMTDFGSINEIYARYFTNYYPARALVEVSRLPKDVLIEIECIIAKTK